MVVLTDSQTACSMIVTPPLNYINIINMIRQILVKLDQSKIIRIQWVRSHCGIPGNELVDQAAKKAHSNDRSVLYPLCLQEVLSDLFMKQMVYWNECWNEEMEITGTGLFLKCIRDKVGERKWSFGRRMDVILTRVRTGHAAVGAYLHRFNMADTDLCSFCKVPDTLQHYLLECYKYGASRQILYDELRKMNIQESSTTMELLLGAASSQKETATLLKITASYIKQTRKISCL